MSVELYTFDTNILFYALDPDAGEKRRVAGRLLASADTERTVILLQTLGELCNAVKKKRSLEVAAAHRWIREAMILLDVIAAIPSDLSDAMLAQQQHNLSFWDAMLWATARRAGCTLVLTEDFQDGRSLGGVTFRNPFVLSKEDLVKLLE